MVTIGHVPRCLSSFFRVQRRCFSKPAWPHFWGLVMAIAMGTEHTIERLNGLLRPHPHRTNDGEFLWRSDFDEAGVLRGIALRLLNRVWRKGEPIYLIVDDTQTLKRAKKMEAVGKLFTEVEQPTLSPLPLERFPFFHEVERIVSRDGHVEVDRAFYSVPPEFLGRTMWVRWDARLVRIFNRRMEQIAVHVKGEAGRFRTRDEHIAPEKINGIERGTVWWLHKVSLIGPEAERWAQAMVRARGIQGVRVLMGLVSLSSRHRPLAIEQACAIARSHGAYHLRVIRQLLKRDGVEQQQFEFIDERPIIRRLSDYGDLVRQAFQETRG